LVCFELSYLIHQYIDRVALSDPDREAIRLLDTSLSYSELALRSDALAASLLASGLCVGDRVGVYLGKSLESVAAVYGIMKAGGVYVPLDVQSPAARISAVIADCGIKHLVSQDALVGAL